MLESVLGMASNARETKHALQEIRALPPLLPPELRGIFALFGGCPGFSAEPASALGFQVFRAPGHHALSSGFGSTSFEGLVIRVGVFGFGP